MSDIASEPHEEIALEYQLDAAPEKVWRAIALPAFRERWLPEASRRFPAWRSSTACGRKALRSTKAP
jgi:uncharacterized protein YndB with AHSA1/START domain